MLDKIACEPVEKFGMRWSLTHDSKIRRRADEAAAKVVQPGAVHEHACDQWIGATRQPARESQPTPTGCEVGILFGKSDGLAAGRQHAERTRRKGFLRLLRIS